MDETRKPRLGDRKDLKIEIWPSAVSSYRQTRLESTGVALTDAEAMEELEDVLLHSSVAYSSGEDMTVRGRVRRLGVDVRSELTRVRPDHVRCTLAQVRKLDTNTGTLARNSGALAARAVYEPIGNGRRKCGYLRLNSKRVIEYRPVAEENGAASPPWGPVPERIRQLALRDGGLRAWLEKYGVET